MRIWHEQLIPKLCQKHLCAMWREGLGVFKIITENKKGYRNHPATKEFEYHLTSLWLRLQSIRNEMLKRNYNPKPLQKSKLADANLPFKEWQTLDEQIAILKAKKCRCQV